MRLNKKKQGEKLRFLFSLKACLKTLGGNLGCEL